MKAPKKVYVCTECDYQTPRWMGQCPSCHQWNTFVEELVSTKKSGTRSTGLSSAGNSERLKPKSLSEIDVSSGQRTRTDIGEMDRVLGGGIVKGSLILIGGDPGIGKSTLLLQVCQHLTAKGVRVLYVSGEESLQQIKLRSMRIGSFSDNLKLLCETNLTDIEGVIEHEKPDMVVIDSIQTMFNEDIQSSPGNVSQVRESTGVLLRIAKTMLIPIFIVGHMTKDGNVAGPRVLEHMVDTVLYFEGDRHASYRMLRGVKNRFGSTNEIGVFEMKNEGLVEVPNPSEFMLNGRPEDSSGSVVGCTMEGTRPILIEIQALVSKTNFGFPRRQSAGSDMNRLNLMMTVLEKRVGVQIGDCDAYVNIAGGMKITEPGVDLGVIIAVMSSYSNKVIPGDVVAFGEVGLSGEVRAVSGAPFRVSECKKLGFKKVILPYGNMEACRETCGIELLPVKSIAQAINCLNVLQNKD